MRFILVHYGCSCEPFTKLMSRFARTYTSLQVMWANDTFITENDRSCSVLILPEASKLHIVEGCVLSIAPLVLQSNDYPL